MDDANRPFYLRAADIRASLVVDAGGLFESNWVVFIRLSIVCSFK